MQLLQDVFIVEKLQVLNEGVNKDTMRIRGVFGRCNEKNNNGRIYPTTVLENQLKKVQPLIQERRLCGELDHPSNDTVKLSNASHLITKLEIKGNELIGEAEILKTPAGLTAKALIDGGVRIGISSRGMGTLSEDAQGNKVVNEDYRLVTFDLVADPSTRGAFPTLAESTQSRFARESQNKLQKESNFVTLLKSKLRGTYKDFLEEGTDPKKGGAKSDPKKEKPEEKSPKKKTVSDFARAWSRGYRGDEWDFDKREDVSENFDSSEVDKSIESDNQKKISEKQRQELLAALRKRRGADRRKTSRRRNLNDRTPTELNKKNESSTYYKIGKLLVEFSAADFDAEQAERQALGKELRARQEGEAAYRRKQSAGRNVPNAPVYDKGSGIRNIGQQLQYSNMANREVRAGIDKDRMERSAALRAANPATRTERAAEYIGNLFNKPRDFARAFGRGYRGEGWTFGDTGNAPRAGSEAARELERKEAERRASETSRTEPTDRPIPPRERTERPIPPRERTERPIPPRERTERGPDTRTQLTRAEIEARRNSPEAIAKRQARQQVATTTAPAPQAGRYAAAAAVRRGLQNLKASRANQQSNTVALSPQQFQNAKIGPTFRLRQPEVPPLKKRRELPPDMDAYRGTEFENQSTTYRKIGKMLGEALGLLEYKDPKTGERYTTPAAAERYERKHGGGVKQDLGKFGTTEFTKTGEGQVLKSKEGKITSVRPHGSKGKLPVPVKLKMKESFIRIGKSLLEKSSERPYSSDPDERVKQRKEGGDWSGSKKGSQSVKMTPEQEENWFADFRERVKKEKEQESLRKQKEQEQLKRERDKK